MGRGVPVLLVLRADRALLRCLPAEPNGHEDGHPAYRDAGGELYAGGYVPAYPYAAALSDAKDRKSTRLNSSHANISYAVFCLKKKKTNNATNRRSDARGKETSSGASSITTGRAASGEVIPPAPTRWMRTATA